MAVGLKDFKNLSFKDLKNLNFDKAKERIDKILAQAKDSLRVLESLQKEGIALAKSIVEIPVATRTKNFTNEKIAKNLGKIGLATREEVKALEKKIESLASELHGQIEKAKKKVTRAEEKTEQ